MLRNMDIQKIIHLKNAGYNHSQIARMTGYDRKTVIRYCSQDDRLHEQALETSDPKDLQAQRERSDFINGKTERKPASRGRWVWTDEVRDRVLQLLEDDEEKQRKSPLARKYALTAVQVHEILVREGFKISYSTVSHEMSKIRKNKPKEAFIRQRYEYGDAVQLDYGFVDLEVDGKMQRFSIAVLVLCASGFVWVYLYPNQDMSTFLDCQIRFIEKIDGVPRRIMYDNLRNAVAKFVGPHGKEYTDDLIRLSNFYRFRIQTMNPRKGNEKGKVECNVSWVRSRLFGVRWKFESVDEIHRWVEEELEVINRNVPLEEERKYLQPRCGNYEIARTVPCSVDKYSTCRHDYVHYSVPDSLVGKKVTAKIYATDIEFWYKREKVAHHGRLFSDEEKKEKWVLDYHHYLTTLKRKKGALENSELLAQWPALKTLCTDHFNGDFRRMIDFLFENRELPIEALIWKAARLNDPSESGKLEEKSQDEIRKSQSLMIGGSHD